MDLQGPAVSDRQQRILDSTLDCVKLLAPDGTLLFMNKAGRSAFGISDDFAFGIPWMSLLPEEVHAGGEAALRDAAGGKSVRFSGKSLSQGGETTYWDNLLIPSVDSDQNIVSIVCVSRDVTEKIILEEKLEEALNRERLLAREMHHRVKNLFSVVSGLTYIADAEARSSGDGTATARILRDKLSSLARASDALFDTNFANGAGTDLIDAEKLISSIMKPYGDRCSISGDTAHLRRDDITTHALLLHELSTNAVKYGALSNASGIISISWSDTKNGFELRWAETGGPELPDIQGRRGFGTDMVDRVVRSAGGVVTRSWLQSGLTVSIRLPSARAIA